MSNLQIQMAALDRKVDALYESIERLSANVNHLLVDADTRAERENQAIAETERALVREASAIESMFEHQDVLVDRDLIGSQRSSDDEKALTPEAQIQRLTAQLTASYNRIAALEEQLLSHSSLNHRLG
ncbi:MAG: hypothetical protein ACFB9N_00695 [Geitlerinemataceae cyanobacterium]